MSRVSAFARRLPVVGVALLSVLLSACVTYPAAYYQPSYPYDDRYGDRYAGDYYYGNDYYDGYGYGYYGWPGGYYSSVLWPTYFHYYDPWHFHGYYYGVTYFPSYWYGLSFGYYDHYPWWGYHHYSPYRHSWADNHWYGGTGWRHGRRDEYSTPRFGSARNEAERLSQMARAERRARSSLGDSDVARYQGGYPVGSRYSGQPGNWSRARDDGSRGAASGGEATRFDARARGASDGQQGRYGRGESGWISGAPERGSRAGFAAPVQSQNPTQGFYRSGPAGDAGASGQADALSRGRDPGYGGLQRAPQPVQAPQPMRIEPSRAPSPPSMSFDRGGHSGSGRSDSGSWSRDRDSDNPD